MKLSTVVLNFVWITTLYSSVDTFGLLGKKNYILAKPRIIIKPQIYIGTGHSHTSRLIAKKKKLAVKTIAVGGAIGLLKKLKPKLPLPKIELPRLFPKIPVSFSFSVDKPKIDIAKSSDHWDDQEKEHDDDIETVDDHLSSHAISEGPWLSGDSLSEFPSYPEEYSVLESKSRKSSSSKSASKSSSSRYKPIKTSSSTRSLSTSKSRSSMRSKPERDEEDRSEESENEKDS